MVLQFFALQTAPESAKHFPSRKEPDRNLRRDFFIEITEKGQKRQWEFETANVLSQRSQAG
jgi:hypothetical protein